MGSQPRNMPATTLASLAARLKSARSKLWDVRARVQALIIGLVVFSAVAVIFAVGPGTGPVTKTADLATPLEIAKLTSQAAWVATHNKDPHPRSATLYATTRAWFRHTTEGGVFHDPRRVYVVSLRGNFTVEHSAPAGVSPITNGTQIIVLYDAKTLEATDASVGWAHDLSKLGPSLRLQVP
jgi:hypothetical protein